MTKLSVIMERLAQAEETSKKSTSKQAQAQAQTEAQTEQAEANDLQELETVHGKTVISDFFADLQGAERLTRKYLKKWNSFGDGSTVLQPTDFDEAKSRVYLAILETPINPDDVELWETTKQYFGIATLQQYRKGYNAFQKMMRENANRSPKAEYNQDYGQTGTGKELTEAQIESHELQQVELELTLKTIFSEELKIQLDMKLQGYTNEEIIKITGVPKRTVVRRNAEIRKILAIAYDIQ